MVIDLNHLGLVPAERADFVKRLSMRLLPYPVGVCIYDLEPETIKTLRAHGVLVFRRLDQEVFRELAKAIDAARANFAA